MGRLFWKILLFTLLAQSLATVGIGGAIWLRERAQEVPALPSDIDTRPQVSFLLESVAATLQYGGQQALVQLLQHPGSRHEIFVVDETGNDLLGRSVTPLLLGHARALLEQPMKRTVVRQVKAPDGHVYLLFAAALGRSRLMPGMMGPGPGPGPAPDEGSHGPGTDDGAGHREPPPAMAGAGPRDGPRDGIRPRRGDFGERGDHGGPPFWSEMLLWRFFPVITAILGSLIFAGLVAWYFSRPIRELRAAFNAAAAGDLNPRLGPGLALRRDELADLGRDFDRMTSQLRDLVDGQRRLMHDVSHELRSPLARLQAAIGLARQRPENLDTSMMRIERESVRMDKLVGEILTLSGLQAHVRVTLDCDIEIEELLAEIVDDAGFEAQGSGTVITLSGHCRGRVRGQVELLHSAIENVLRNALKYTAPGSTINIHGTLLADPPALRLAILDQGSGVPEAELASIFEPFFRGSAARADASGHGLGLAIAQRVIQAHGGSIRAVNAVGGGLCVEITLPLLAPPAA